MTGYERTVSILSVDIKHKQREGAWFARILFLV